MQQHQVEVAERSGVTASQAANTGKGYPVHTGSVSCSHPQLGDPAPAQLRHGCAPHLPGTRGCEAPGAGQVQTLLVQVHSLSLPQSHH